DSATDRPSGIGLVDPGGEGGGGADVADRKTAREVRHPAVDGVAHPAACSGEKGVLGGTDIYRAADSAVHQAVAGDVGPVNVGFEAVDEVAELPIVADLATEQSALDVEARAQRAPIGGAPAVSSIGTDVEAGPVVDRRRIVDRRRRLPVDRTAEVGCGRRTAQS